MKACRICLISKVRLSKLKDHRAAAFLEKIFKNEGYMQPFSANHYACFECKALLRKSYNFIQKALAAQSILYDLLKEHKVITAPILQAIDRKELQCNSTLSYHKVIVNLCLTDMQDDVNEEKVFFKQEHSNSDIIYELCNEEENVIFIDEKSFDGRSINDSTDDDKESNKIKSFDESSINDSTDDNKESYRITKKRSKKRRRRRRGPVKKIKVDTDLEIPDSKKNKIRKIKVRPEGVKISVENIIEGQRRKIKPKQVPDMVEGSFSSEYDTVNEEKELIKSHDQEYDPKENSEEDSSESSDTSYDENGKAKAKPRDYREFPMKCDHCDYVVPKKSMHYHHYLICHPREEYPYKSKEMHVCSTCGVTKTSTFHLREHELTHEEKNLACDICGKKFYNLKHLKQHKKRHDRPSLFCDYCGKGFIERVEIVRHIRTHTGDKPFKCPICGAGFAHSGNVKIHINSAHAHSVRGDDRVSKKRKTKKPKKTKSRANANFAVQEEADDELLLKQFKIPKIKTNSAHACSEGLNGDDSRKNSANAPVNAYSSEEDDGIPLINIKKMKDTGANTDK